MGQTQSKRHSRALLTPNPPSPSTTSSPPQSPTISLPLTPPRPLTRLSELIDPDTLLQTQLDALQLANPAAVHYCDYDQSPPSPLSPSSPSSPPSEEEGKEGQEGEQREQGQEAGRQQRCLPGIITSPSGNLLDARAYYLHPARPLTLGERRERIRARVEGVGAGVGVAGGDVERGVEGGVVGDGKKGKRMRGCFWCFLRRGE